MSRINQRRRRQLRRELAGFTPGPQNQQRGPRHQQKGLQNNYPSPINHNVNKTKIIYKQSDDHPHTNYRPWYNWYYDLYYGPTPLRPQYDTDSVNSSTNTALLYNKLSALEEKINSDKKKKNNDEINIYKIVLLSLVVVGLGYYILNVKKK